MKHLLCLLNVHEWHYRFDDLNRRYCIRRGSCRREERRIPRDIGTWWDERDVGAPP